MQPQTKIIGDFLAHNLGVEPVHTNRLVWAPFAMSLLDHPAYGISMVQGANDTGIIDICRDTLRGRETTANLQKAKDEIGLAHRTGSPAFHAGWAALSIIRACSDPHHAADACWYSVHAAQEKGAGSQKDLFRMQHSYLASLVSSTVERMEF